MKEQEGKKQIVLNLSLPLVEIPNDQIYDCKNYPENGLYFVKDTSGCYYVSNVKKEENCCWFTSLPPDLGNLLVEQQTIISMMDVVEEKLQRIEEVVLSSTNRTVECIEHNSKTIASKIENLRDKCEEKEVSIQDIPQSVVALLNNQQPQQSVKGMGFVSQEVLVEIIRTIK